MARRDDDDDDEDYDDDDGDDGRSQKRSRRGPTKDDKQMAMFCHIGGLIFFLLPLILWMTQKEKSSFVDEHGKEAVNFQLTILIGHFLGIFTCGILNLIMIPFVIIYSIMAGMAASKGEDYQYPICIRFIN